MDCRDEAIGNDGKSRDRHQIKPKPCQHQRHALHPCPARGLGRCMGIQPITKPAKEARCHPFGRQSEPKHQHELPGSIQYTPLRHGIAHEGSKPIQHRRQIGNGADGCDQLVRCGRQSLRRPLQQLRAKRIGRKQGRFGAGIGWRCLGFRFRRGGAQCADQFSPAAIILQDLEQRLDLGRDNGTCRRNGRRWLRHGVARFRLRHGLARQQDEAQEQG